MQQPWKLRVLALCLATGLSAVSAQDFNTPPYDTTTGSETSTDVGLPVVEPTPSTDVAIPEASSEPFVEAPPSATSEAQVEIQPTSANQDQSSTPVVLQPEGTTSTGKFEPSIPVVPEGEETAPTAEPSTENVPQQLSTETQPEPLIPTTETQPQQLDTTIPINIPSDTATGPVQLIDTTTGPIEAPSQPPQTGPAQDTATDLTLSVPEATTESQTPVAPTQTEEAAELSTQVNEEPPAVSSGSTDPAESTVQPPAPENTIETTPEAAEPTTHVNEPTTEGKPQEPSTESVQIPAEPTTEQQAPAQTTEEAAPEQTTKSEDTVEPTQDGPDPKPTEDNGPSTKNEPGQTSAPDEPEKTTANPDATPTEDGIVTGTNGAVVTYVPEQDKDFSDFTGTTTTTDDGGAAIVIFPGGWFWKPSGNLPAGILPGPPAAVPGPVGGSGGGAPGEGEGDDNEDDDDDEKSTKQEEKSTTAQTTAKTTGATTTSTEGCSAVEIEDCTRTISYYTTDGTLTHTEFGDCPTIASCATGTQATATTTASAEVEEGVTMQIDEADIDIPDNFDEPVPDDIAKDFEHEMDEYLGASATTMSVEPTSTTAETTGEATPTGGSTETTSETKQETTTSEATTERTTDVPSTLITMTRNTESSDTTSDGTSSDEVTSMASSTEVPTTTTSIRTYYPCVPNGGPNVATPQCQCETTSDGKHLVATAPLVSQACDAYTEFPMSLYTTPPPAPTPTVFNEPFTETDAGTVLVWQSYSLSEWKIMGHPVTNTIGLGEPSTVSTPVPTATDTDGHGSDICTSSDKNVRNALSSACDNALDQFEDDTVYDKYTGRYNGMGSILKTLTFGKASCIIQFSCDDYGIGMKGSDIKAIRESHREDVGRCGNIYLSNSCKIHLDYCTSCKKEN